MALAVLEMHLEMGAADFAPGLFRSFDPVSGNGQGREIAPQHFQRQARVNQRAQQHVAAGPANGLDIGNFHANLDTDRTSVRVILSAFRESYSEGVPVA